MTIKINCDDCDTIEEPCKQAIKLAIENNEDVVFEFNKIEVKVTPESNYDDLITEYLVKCHALFRNEIVSGLFDKLNQDGLLLQYLYAFKNNKQKPNRS